MGIIARQTFKHSIVNYLGVFLGALSILFIYPLSLEEYGLSQFLLDGAFLASPLILLSANLISLKFFPEFRSIKKDGRGYQTLLIGVFLIGFLIFCILTFLFKDFILGYYRQKSDSQLFLDYLPYIIPIAFFLCLSILLTSFSYNLKRIVVPAIFNLGIKIVLPTLILLYYFEKITLDVLILGIVVNFAIISIGLLIYLNRQGHLQLSIDKSLLSGKFTKRIFEFGAFSILTGLGSMVAARIDSLMVGTFIDLETNGIYKIAHFFAIAVGIPMAAIANISTPIISEKWQNNQVSEIQSIYQKSSVNLLSLGFLFFILAWTNLDDIFAIIPNGEKISLGKYAILFLILAKLVDMGTGINQQIIAFSKKYKFNFYAILILAVLNVITNYLLIPRFGLTGAAIATCFSILIFNFSKLIFLYINYRIQPFTQATIKLISITLVCFVIAYLVPTFNSPYISILIRSITVFAVYSGFIYFFKISEDINTFLNLGWRDKLGF